MSMAKPKYLTIGELFTFLPKSQAKAGDAQEEGEFPFFTSSQETIKRTNQAGYSGECLIFGTGGHPSVHCYKGMFQTSTDCFVLQADSKPFYAQYVYFYLKKNRHILAKGFKGAGIKHISKSYLSSISIPIYEDKIPQICYLLSQAEKLIELRKQAIQILEKLVESTFIDLFGNPEKNNKKWEYVKIQKIAAKFQYGTSMLADAGDDGISIIRMNNITYKGYIDLTDTKKIYLSANEIKKYTAQKGDLLFNRTNSRELVGKCAIWNQEDTFVVAGYLIMLRFKEELALPEFVWAFLNSNYGKHSLIHKAKQTVNMANISASSLMKIEVFLPPLSLQLKYKQIIAELLITRSKMQSHLKEAESLLQSLMQQAFTSEIKLNAISVENIIAIPTKETIMPQKPSLEKHNLREYIQQHFPVSAFRFGELEEKLMTHFANYQYKEVQKWIVEGLSEEAWLAQHFHKPKERGEEAFVSLKLKP